MMRSGSRALKQICLIVSINKQIATDHLMYTIFKMLFSTHIKTGIIRKVLFWWPFSSDTCEQSYNPEEKKSVFAIK